MICIQVVHADENECSPVDISVYDGIAVYPFVNYRISQQMITPYLS